jgi:hypothetical protein
MRGEILGSNPNTVKTSGDLTMKESVDGRKITSRVGELLTFFHFSCQHWRRVRGFLIN